ncbi:MAG: TrkA C-terminal domain-containing protein [Candidatus Methanoperedenaceae archaeon]|nr:TrkA C-terminal domain-containing protein [Candidatus Methanoperedenaceae archaeon]
MVRKDGYEMFRSAHQKYTVFPELRQHLPDIEIETIRIEEASPLAGKTLAQVGFRKKYGVTVLVIQRGKQTITNPSGDTLLLAQDIVVLMGTKDNIVGVTSLILSHD